VQNVAFGSTATYKTIATEIGNPSASLAVGAANGSNRLAIIVPCHRLVRTDGGLAGYAAGLDKKSWLLEFEKGVAEHSRRMEI
jgi:O-6-methylguanine DNA methyltransferase